ncbi:MAG: inosine-uridine nucleoside N-ribohydrolase [Microbacterium sp.]|jgi:hypothetical protein|nr:inosine-uridine nucleoside N-ribohydrolase [Microbacterium sp.]
MTQAPDATDLVRLDAIPGALPRALAAMLPAYLDFYEGRVFPDRRCALHDPLAAMVAAGALRGVSVARGQIDVRLERGERGRTVSSHASDTQRWVRGMEGSAVELLLDTLEGRVWPGSDFKLEAAATVEPRRQPRCIAIGNLAWEAVRLSSLFAPAPMAFIEQRAYSLTVVSAVSR